MSELRITYLSELSNDYAAALSAAKTLDVLKLLLNDWRRVANDAREVVETWTNADFKDWRKALASERRGKFMGEKAAERFALVLMPEVLFQVQRVSAHFSAPWGLCFIRMKEAGQIVEHDGIAEIVQPSEDTAEGTARKTGEA